MKKNSFTILPLAPAHLVGMGAFQIAIIMFFFNPKLALVPLVFFLILCFTAPFAPGFSFFLPIVSRGSSKGEKVTLSFDDGPDSEITPLVLKLLKKHNIRAMFYLVGQKAESNPELVKKIISHGHEIGNHSYSHDSFLMFRSRKVLSEEIIKASHVLKDLGVTPVTFRPPVGITNPRLWRVLLESGMFCVNFNCRAYDMGNRFLSNLSRRILKKVKANDIILLHDVKPHDNRKSKLLIDEIEKVIIGLKEKGFDLVPLSQLLKKPVMVSEKKEPGPVETFYDGLALNYDIEQEYSKVSLARKSEIKLFDVNLLPIINNNHKVLELGAGTGRFTIPISSKCREIYALDISKNMIEMLMNKINNNLINNIKPLIGDVFSLNDDEKFDIICSFSSMEYIADISLVFDKLFKLLKPGGKVYFITANRSIFRFFIQIGNAMRQGLWLHARGKGEIVRKLRKCGFSEVEVSTHCLKFLFFGGILMEVRAKK